jgi:hypothetical protein
MGLFVNIQGRFGGVRSRKIFDSCIQTKLLRSEADNCYRHYTVGDSEVMDGRADYCPLSPWDDRSPLVVALGDWDCINCGLNWQWAKAVLTDTVAATMSHGVLSGYTPVSFFSGGAVRFGVRQFLCRFRI